MANVAVTDNHRHLVRPAMEIPTPYLLTDLDVVERRLAALKKAVPGLAPFYAMKCNPAPEILRTLAAGGASFEVASIGELRMVQAIGMDAAALLYSNPVKPIAHIEQAHQAGLWRFCVDGRGEVAKIARWAPGASVYVRLRVDDTGSVVPLSRKFGTSIGDAHELMLLARRLGLRPYGVTFHVGSQAMQPTAWRSALMNAAELMRRLLADGIELQMLDLGGGFPARYIQDVPSIETIGMAIADGLHALPYRPALLAAEPGRYLVAEAGVLATSVVGRERRDDENWLFLQIGNYHAMGEVLPTPGGWQYPIWTSVDGASPLVPFVLTGPTCDQTDTFAYGVQLPAAVAVGDIVYIGTAGAYTLSYATHFNGFTPPTQAFVGGSEHARG
jgi:ornithine decarboxylase